MTTPETGSIWRSKVNGETLRTVRVIEADPTGFITTETLTTADGKPPRRSTRSRVRASLWDRTFVPADSEPPVYKFDPDWCIRPGVHLREFMEESNLSSRIVASVCGTTPEVIDGILDGTERITAKISDGLSRLGISSTFWLNLERIYRDGLERGKTDLSTEYDE